MSSEEIKRHGAGEGGPKRTTGHNPAAAAGEVLHQRRSLPFSLTTMTVAGLLIVGAVGYFTLYARAKPGTTPSEVAKVAAGASDYDGGGEGGSQRPGK